MITLYADPTCEACGHLADKLSEFHIAHHVERADPAGQEHHRPHTLDDNGDIVRGHERIDERIDQAWELIQKATRYQGDYCMHYGDQDDPGFREC